MKDIIIKQVGKSCLVTHGEETIFQGGRIAAKRAAHSLHLETGDPVWNWKNNNKKVTVYYATPKQVCRLCGDFVSGDTAIFGGEVAHADCVMDAVQG